MNIHDGARRIACATIGSGLAFEGAYTDRMYLIAAGVALAGNTLSHGTDRGTAKPLKSQRSKPIDKLTKLEHDLAELRLSYRVDEWDYCTNWSAFEFGVTRILRDHGWGC